jgi:hypothetical protein
MDNPSPPPAAPQPETPVVSGARRAAAPPAEPHSDAELGAALYSPLRIVDLVLATPERVAANVDARLALGRIAMLFLAAGFAFTVPYSLVLGLGSWWRLTALYLGSTLICLPSLYVFTSYSGARTSLGQVGVLALLIPASSAIFTLGFAPILEFLHLTMDKDSEGVGWSSISTAMLGVSLAAGVLQLWRCFFEARKQSNSLILGLVLVVWHVVFVYVFVRMFTVLEL